MTELVGCAYCGHQTAHHTECITQRITQVRLGEMRVMAEVVGRRKGLSLSAVIRLAVAEWLARNGG